MIGLDTNVLARYFLSGDDASATTARQEKSAQRILEGDEPLHVCKTVLLELEWVMRGLHATAPSQFVALLEHLLALPHVTIEDRLSVEAALGSHRSGLDFADALHHASYRTCASLASFDDRKFGRRVARLGLLPPVTVPR